jgi:hypothetical protein
MPEKEITEFFGTSYPGMTSGALALASPGHRILNKKSGQVEKSYLPRLDGYCFSLLIAQAHAHHADIPLDPQTPVNLSPVAPDDGDKFIILVEIALVDR